MHPILFSVPGVGWAVHSYGAAMGLALLVAWIVALDRARRDGLPTEALGSIFVAAAVAALLGARALWLAGHPELATGLGALLQLPAGGLSLVGGAFAALVTTALGCHLRGVATFAWLDCVAPGFAVGAAIERLGAFLAGADFGRYVAPGEWGYALAVTFPAGSPAHAVHSRILDGLGVVSDAASAPVHPVQLYAAALALAALGLALWLRPRRRYAGQVALAVLAFYIVARLGIEDPLRFDGTEPVWGALRRGHVAALGLLGVIAGVARIQRRAAGRGAP